MKCFVCDNVNNNVQILEISVSMSIIGYMYVR